MKCKRNAIASVFKANASFFNANAFQVHSKCNANAFFRSICNANASNFNANASVFYASALLLHDINEIYRFTLYISFHYIYRVGENPPFATKIGINFNEFGIFYLSLPKKITTMDEKTKQLLEKSHQLINEIRWKRVAPRIIPRAKQMLAELGNINSNFETALTPERLRDCREQILVFLQWFAEQERKYPGAPWLIQNGAMVMINKTRNRYNELLYQLAKKYYGKVIIGWIDKEAQNFPIIKEAIEQENGFDDEESRDLRKALYIGK